MPTGPAQPLPGEDLAAQNWPGAGVNYGQTPTPWVTSAPIQPASGPAQGPAPWVASAPVQPVSGPGQAPPPWSAANATTQPQWTGANDANATTQPQWADANAANAANATTQPQWSGANAANAATQPHWAAASVPAQPQWVTNEPPDQDPSRRPVWIFPAIVAVVLLLAAGTVAFVLRDRILGDDQAGSPTTGPTATSNPIAPTTAAAAPTETATGDPTPTPAQTTASPPTVPASVGAVRLDPSLDPTQGPAVAAVFDKYFAAVNARNAGSALAVMDPNGSINQSDSAAVKRFTDGISTSTDDDVLLLALGPDGSGKGLLQARVTFRSQQQSGKGPKGRESETCTRWDVTYSITRPGGEYRIWGSTNAGNRPC
ncbi:hypothetical protein [Dactylosporangium sp. CS-033363]|uniref:hypothetical protein n=1 Tax=Dactylosporangium sp. CS-033363 TaxID=3239935 RepID=UPI003D8D88F3